MPTVGDTFLGYPVAAVNAFAITLTLPNNISLAVDAQVVQNNLLLLMQAGLYQAQLPPTN